jgi:hypothetical protein
VSRHADEGKLRESAERAVEEERKRSAELAEQLRSEQQLRAEAETKLQQANKEVHERVAKVSPQAIAFFSLSFFFPLPTQ